MGMDEDDGSEYGHGDTEEESVDDSEQSEDKNHYEINTRGPTSVTYGAPYYEIRTGAGIGGLLRARYRRGIGGLIKGCYLNKACIVYPNNKINYYKTIHVYHYYF